MKCPKCGGAKCPVVESWRTAHVHTPHESRVLRVRRCAKPACKHRFTTVEVLGDHRQHEKPYRGAPRGKSPF